MAERILYLESVAGIAGDMFTAAFLDAGLVDTGTVQNVPGLLGHGEVQVEISASERSGAMTTHLDVILPGGRKEGKDDGGHQTDHSHGHSHHGHYHYPALVKELQASGLGDTAKSFALRVFRLLAEAEAHAHGVPLEKVVFHEVGALDSVVDVAMAGVCLETVGAHRVLASPVKLGRGSIRIAHGTYPVPPPATARLALGMPVAEVPEAIIRENVELSTPTGLAILRALEPEFVTGWPGGTLLAQGLGSGTMELDGYPNVFRVALLEGGRETSSLPYLQDRVLEIRCNVDDQTGERTAWLMERGLVMGALDAWVTPVVGKKGRPAQEMTFLVRPEHRDPVVDFILRHSTTLGVRFSSWDRMKLMREQETRDTPHGPVSFKVGKNTRGEILKEKPEYENLKTIWEEEPDFS